MEASNGRGHYTSIIILSHAPDSEKFAEVEGDRAVEVLKMAGFSVLNASDADHAQALLSAAHDLTTRLFRYALYHPEDDPPLDEAEAIPPQAEHDEPISTQETT